MGICVVIAVAVLSSVPPPKDDLESTTETREASGPAEASRKREPPLRPEGPEALPETSDEILGDAQENAVTAEVTGSPDEDEPAVPQLELDPTPAGLRNPNWAFGWRGEHWRLTLRPLDDSGLADAGPAGSTPRSSALMGDVPALRPLAGLTTPTEADPTRPGSAGAGFTFDFALPVRRDPLDRRPLPRIGLYVSLQAQGGGYAGAAPAGESPDHVNAGTAATIGLIIRF